jgi:hypothetical protein
MNSIEEKRWESVPCEGSAGSVPCEGSRGSVFRGLEPKVCS